jgi:hypothetical protein
MSLLSSPSWVSSSAPRNAFVCITI